MPAWLLLQFAILGALAEPGPGPRTLWSLRGGVEDFSLRRSRQQKLADINNHLHEEGEDTHPPGPGVASALQAAEDELIADHAFTSTPTMRTTTPSPDEEELLTEAPTELATTTESVDPSRPAGLVRTRRMARVGPAAAQSKMHKVALTQIGYIQFLRYLVEVPDLHEFSFCLWLRSKNITHNHPIFSYSRNERERLVRAWVSAGTPPRLHLRVLERDVLPGPVPLPEAAHRRWLHICLSWDGRDGRYGLYVDGKPRLSGQRREVARLSLPGGGDVVVGQEYTDFDKGLDDGIEGEVFGFYLFRTATPPMRHDSSEGARGEDEQGQQGLRRRRGRGPFVLYDPPEGFMKRTPRRVQWLYALCTDELEDEDRGDAVVSWPGTPVRVFGGAIISNINGQCGHF